MSFIDTTKPAAPCPECEGDLSYPSEGAILRADATGYYDPDDWATCPACEWSGTITEAEAAVEDREAEVEAVLDEEEAEWEAVKSHPLVKSLFGENFERLVPPLEEGK